MNAEYSKQLMSYIRKGRILFFVWFSDLSAIRLPLRRFGIMNFAMKRLMQLFSGYRVKAYGIDGRGKLPRILGKYCYNEWITGICLAWVQVCDSSWGRGRIVLAVFK